MSNKITTHRQSGVIGVEDTAHVKVTSRMGSPLEYDQAFFKRNAQVAVIDAQNINDAFVYPSTFLIVNSSRLLPDGISFRASTMLDWSFSFTYLDKDNRVQDVKCWVQNELGGQYLDISNVSYRAFTEIMDNGAELLFRHDPEDPEGFFWEIISLPVDGFDNSNNNTIATARSKYHYEKGKYNQYYPCVRFYDGEYNTNHFFDVCVVPDGTSLDGGFTHELPTAYIDTSGGSNFSIQIFNTLSFNMNLYCWAYRKYYMPLPYDNIAPADHCEFIGNGNDNYSTFSHGTVSMQDYI